MVLDSLFNKEVRLLKKVEKLHSKGNDLISSDSKQAHEILTEALNMVEENKNMIKDKKSDFSVVLAEIGYLLSQLDDYKNGDLALKKAIEYDSGNVKAYIYYANTLNKRKNYDLAQSVIDKAININRRSKEAWETKAQIYENMGDIDEALKIYLNLINLYPDDIKYYDRYLKHKPNDEKVLVKKGILLYNTKDFAGAAKTMETVVNLSPHNKEAYLYLGAAYEKLEKYEDAINAFKKAIEIDPKDKHGWINLAVIYKRRGEYADALKVVKEGVKIDPNDPKIWQLKGEIEYYMGNYDDALSSAEQASSLDKKSVGALLLLRDIIKKNYSAEKMADTCYKIINLGKRDVDIYYDLAEAYFNMKDYERALEVIETVLSTTPHHLPTLILKKNVFIAMDKCEKAIETAEKVVDIDPKNTDSMVDISKCYEKLGKYESALHAIKRATEIDSKNVELLKMQRDLAKRVNKPTEIITACIGITSIVDDFESYIDLARAYYTMGRYGEAKSAMEKALRLKESADAWNLNGMINYKLGDFEKAKNAFQRATEIEPGVKKYWSNLGWILEKLEKYKEAISCFDRAIEIDPKDMRIWYEKGLCLEKLGDWEAALKCFDEALKINPDFLKALVEKGGALIELGHLDSALDVFNKIIKIEPNNHLALYKKAYIEFEKGNVEACQKDIEEALKYRKEEKYLELKKECCKKVNDSDCIINVSREILDINGRNMSTYRDLAQAYMEEGKVDSAIATYKRALQVYPDNETFLYELKEIYRREKRYADLIEIGKSILAINPEDFSTLLDMGEAYMNLEKYDEAENYLVRAMNIKKTKEAYDLMGELYMNKKDYHEAINNFSKSINIAEDPEIYYRIAKAQYKLGEYDLALSAIRSALRHDKKVKYYLLGAKLYQEIEDSANAIKFAKEALNLEDNKEIRIFLGKILLDAGENVEVVNILKPPAKDGDVEALKLLATALEREGKKEEAIEIYKKIIGKKEDCVDAYIGMGRIYTSIDKYEEARNAYEKAYKLNPNDVNVCQSLAFIYEKIGNEKDALKYLDFGIEIEPENKHLWTTKGRILLNTGKYEDAKRAYQKAISIDSDFRPAVEGLKDVERKIEEEEIENYARSVLEEENRTGNRVTKKVAFKKLNIPLAIIPRVFKYIEEEVPMSVEDLEPEEKLKYDKATLVIAKKLNKIENIKLHEIVGNTKISVNGAKRLLKYIEYCLSAAPDDDVTPEDERLVRKALDLDLKNLSALNIMLNLEVGICKAKKIQKIMREFLDEDVDTHSETDYGTGRETPEFPVEKEKLESSSEAEENDIENDTEENDDEQRKEKDDGLYL